MQPQGFLSLGNWLCTFADMSMSGFLWVLLFVPTSQKHVRRWTGDFKLTLWEIGCVHGVLQWTIDQSRLYFCDIPDQDKAEDD